MVHAQRSVHRYGGNLDDYLPMHEWMDSSKKCVPDMRHRAILHSSFGIYLATDFFGHHFTNSDGREIATRDILEEHVIEDMGRIPTMQDYLTDMPMYDWLGGKKIKRQFTIEMVD